MSKILTTRGLVLVFSISCLLIFTGGCSTAAPQWTPTPAIEFTPEPLPTIAPAPTSTEAFPLTVEDSIMAALLNYRTNGYEALKSTWLTDEYAQEMNYTDFLAASVNNLPTTPSALMGWEIQKVENETDTTKPQGSMRALVKTTYQGGTAMCRWLLLYPPQATGNHWRIAKSEIVPCEGEAASQGMTNTPAPAQSSSSQRIWYPCGNEAPASALSIGSVAYVNPVPPLSVRIWSNPSPEGALMDWLNPGSVVTISDGPACYQGRVYWKVHFKNYLLTGDISSFEEYDGWIAEMESASNYLLLPCPASGPCGGGFTPARTRYPMNDKNWMTQRAK